MELAFRGKLLSDSEKDCHRKAKGYSTALRAGPDEMRTMSATWWVEWKIWSRKAGMEE